MELGDVSLTTGCYLIPESALTVLVRPLFYVKFPTGDEDKGLGTGGLDLGDGLTDASSDFGTGASITIDY